MVLERVDQYGLSYADSGRQLGLTTSGAAQVKAQPPEHKLFTTHRLHAFVKDQTNKF